VVINVGNSDTFIWDYPLDMNGDMTITLDNNSIIQFAADLNVTGNIPLTNSGSSALLFIDPGVTVHVIAGINGDMGDPGNNNVSFIVNGDLIVDGTLSGKNSNAFAGSGTISGGTLLLDNGASCTSPCPLTGGFDTCTAGGGFCTTFGVLPIELLYFDSEVVTNTINLNWATSLEENFSHFVVEHSVNGYFFDALEEIPGAGYNTDDVQEYSYIHKQPVLGINYYRLKAVDLDGAVEYFGPVSERFFGDKAVWIYPNPASGDRVSYHLNFTPNEGDRILIYNQLGSVLADEPARPDPGTMNFNDLLKAGTYIFKYQSPSRVLYARFIVVN
jgi:hypothetical protein